MHYIGNIRTFHIDRFTVNVDAYYEDMPVDVDDDGETARARVHVVVLYRGTVIGESHLGGCIYESIHEAIGEARKTLQDMGKVQIE